MSVSVASCSVSQLFSKEAITSSSGQKITGKITIPEYQRPYCWQDQQLAKLLADIKAHTKSAAQLPYYLGSLIIHQNGEALNLIDGQQRVTTLALLGYLNGQLPAVDLRFESPTSQQQIKHNLAWLKQRLRDWAEDINFDRLQLTLVITESEDDAYRFFETQNTGGVRLSGPDIIKAHHLRAVTNLQQGTVAKQWESLGDLNTVVLALLKGRYWQNILLRELPSHRQPKQVRECIVSELADNTRDGTSDVAYGRIKHLVAQDGCFQLLSQQGYEVRQPLNAGVNTVSYLAYFQQLYNRYWESLDLPHLAGYVTFCKWLKNLEGCGYLEELYQTCLLLYLSHFGEDQLEIAAKKLFRVVYSRRVSNQKSVRENSIYAFVRDYPVLDWIVLSYTPEQCFTFLDQFELEINPSNIDKNSVKRRFMEKVREQFALAVKSVTNSDAFGVELTSKIAKLGRDA